MDVWNLGSSLNSSSHAHYCLGDYKAAASAFRRGLEQDPDNASLKTGLKNAEARIEPEDQDELPPLGAPGDFGSDASAGAGAGGMADLLRNMGAGGGGGMPDIAGLMNNPAMMQMAQQMMQNGGMERLMQNPALANMVRGVSSSQVQSGN